MDIYTKVFLINWVVVWSMSILDTHVLDNYIENHKFLGFMSGVWVLCSFASIPAWLIYLIYTWGIN